MRKVLQCILLKTMAALAVLEDFVNGAIGRERVFRDREDLLAHDGDWLISHFKGNPPGTVRRAAASIGAQQRGAMRCLCPQVMCTGEDIFNAFMGFVSETKLPLFKLISITTDGAPAMLGRTSGFIALCKESEYLPDILNYHCIIHQQVLCGKNLNMKEVMDIAMKTVCSVRARSLQRRLFLLTWRRMMLSTQTCCFTRMLGG